LPNYVIGIP